MKSSYELAMERLNKTSPTVKLTAETKKKLAELDSIYAAKIAERELALKDEIERAANAGDVEKMEELKQRLGIERKTLQSQLEDKKEELRRAK